MRYEVSMLAVSQQITKDQFAFCCEEQIQEIELIPRTMGDIQGVFELNNNPFDDTDGQVEQQSGYEFFVFRASFVYSCGVLYSTEPTFTDAIEVFKMKRRSSAKIQLAQSAMAQS